jgi:transposase
MGVAIYFVEFKDWVIKQVLDGGCPVREVAKRLGVSGKSIYTWLRERAGRTRAAKNIEAEGSVFIELPRRNQEDDLYDFVADLLPEN